MSQSDDYPDLDFDVEISAEDENEIIHINSIPDEELTKAHITRLNCILQSYGLPPVARNVESLPSSRSPPLVEEPFKRVAFQDSVTSSTCPVYNKPSRWKEKKLRRTFNVQAFLQYPLKFTGKNTLFGRYRASFFLLNFYYPKQLNIVSNNEKFKKFSFYTDRKNPSRNYVFSNFVNGVFRFLNFHKNLPEHVRLKYFKTVRRHLHEQYTAVSRRLSSAATLKNNNQTRTYFRFSVENQVYYFGFYLPCISDLCHAPPSFVTKHGARCWLHWKMFCQSNTPNPSIHHHEMSNVPKKITSFRLGVSYTKEISFSERLNKFFVVYKNFNYLPNISRIQSCRFSRLTRSPKSNDFKKLITADKKHTAHACKHQPVIKHRQYTHDVVSLLPPPPTELSSDDIAYLAALDEARLSRLQQHQINNSVLFQISQQQIFTKDLKEPAPSATADFDPIVETLPVPDGFVRRSRPNK